MWIKKHLFFLKKYKSHEHENGRAETGTRVLATLQEILLKVVSVLRDAWRTTTIFRFSFQQLCNWCSASLPSAYTRRSCFTFKTAERKVDETCGVSTLRRGRDRLQTFRVEKSQTFLSVTSFSFVHKHI